MTPYGSTSNTVNVFADKQTMTKVIQVGEDFRCVLKVSKGLVNDYMLYLSDSSGVGFTDANLPDFVKYALAVINVRKKDEYPIEFTPDIFTPTEEPIGYRIDAAHYVLVVSPEQLKEIRTYPLFHEVSKYTIQQLREFFQQKNQAQNNWGSIASSTQMAQWNSSTSTQNTLSSSYHYQRALAQQQHAAQQAAYTQLVNLGNQLSATAIPTTISVPIHTPAVPHKPFTITSWIKSIAPKKKVKSPSLVERYRKPKVNQ